MAPRTSRGSNRKLAVARCIIVALALCLGYLLWRSYNPNVDRPVRIIAPVSKKLFSGRQLLDRITKGGLVFYFRHFHTSRIGVTDDLRQLEHGKLHLTDFTDCSWQRPLLPLGVKRARAVGGAMRHFGVQFDRAFSSPYCRCVEGAKQLVAIEPQRELGLVFRKGNFSREEMERFLDTLLRKHLGTSRFNTLVMSHRPSMDNVGFIEEGETFIFEKADPEGYHLIGKVKSSEWIEARFDLSLLGIEGAINYKRE